ncbi:hypothetical protein PMAYCL1PPCAC_05535, partial [Pristionchus mayeri]
TNTDSSPLEKHQTQQSQQHQHDHQLPQSNVIQTPLQQSTLHRPVPQRLPSISFPSAPTQGARPLENLNLFNEYIRRSTTTIGLPSGRFWVQPATPSAAAAAATSNSLQQTTGRPGDVQPALGPAANAPFPFGNLYASHFNLSPTSSSLFSTNTAFTSPAQAHHH